MSFITCYFFFFQAEDGIRDHCVTGVQTCALPISNVRRVLGRAFGSKDVWKLAERLVPRNGQRAWRFNQALMELGALVCTARKPKCPECPVRNDCLAVRSGVQIRSPRAAHPR